MKGTSDPTEHLRQLRGDAAPTAYLNYILFNSNYEVLDMGSEPVPGPSMSKTKISFSTLNIEEAGYVFAYLSYEGESDNWVYFDDFKVTHTKTNVLQYNEYYPFGLQTSRSWTREGSENRFLYNGGAELNNNTAWYETFFRGYDAQLGRFLQVDPLAYMFDNLTPYNYAFNNPVLLNDPMGDKPQEIMYQWGSIRGGGGGGGYSYDSGDGFTTGGSSGSGMFSWGMGNHSNTRLSGIDAGPSYEEWVAENSEVYSVDPNDFAAFLNGDWSVATQLDITSGDNGEFGYYEGYTNTRMGEDGIIEFSYNSRFVSIEAQQGGTAYVFGSDGRLIESHEALGGDVVRFGTEVVFNDVAALKQFVAIVAGESGNNLDEATAIAQVMMNRLNHRGAGLTAGFVNKIGGAGQYDAIGANIYNSVMNSSLTEIFSSDFAYATRVQGAMRALGGGLDISGGAYFWNASSPQTGFNWNQYNNGTFVQTAAYGGTTFFKYADGRKWP